MQSKNKRKDVYVIMNAMQVNPGFCQLSDFQLTGLVMIVPVLIVYFKLREALQPNFFLIGVECIELFYPMRTVVITAFVNGDNLTFFPSKQCL